MATNIFCYLVISLVLDLKLTKIKNKKLKKYEKTNIRSEIFSSCKSRKWFRYHSRTEKKKIGDIIRGQSHKLNFNAFFT